jgi:hypothetical protein
VIPRPDPALDAAIPEKWGHIRTPGEKAKIAESQAPVIRVTIGRVDVRAQFPAGAVTQAPPRRKQASPLSLEEYARQRSEGRR